MNHMPHSKGLPHEQACKGLPKVSVGMPTFNRPHGLRRALEGIVGQTYPNLEIIVSNNASPGDEVEAIMREFMRRDARIRYYRQPENFGPDHNFQFVLDKATGEYFMWAADDDWRALEFVEELVHQLNVHPEASLAFCDFTAASETGERVPGYPDFLPMIRRFTTHSTVLRRMRFFLQNDRHGKANLIYGLIRRKWLQGFVLEAFYKRTGRYGADMLLVFWLLGRGPLALCEKHLYRCTVGNEKHYEASTVRRNGRLGRIWSVGRMLLGYSYAYLNVAGWYERIFLFFCWPLKVLQLMRALRG